MSIKGDDQLAELLQLLPERVARKVTRQAVNAGSTPVLKAARRNVPKDEGTLKKALTKKIVTYKESQTVVAIIGPKDKAAPHAHLVEYGTGPRQTKDGKSTGVMPASGFLRKSMDEQRQDALDKIADKMGSGIKREAAKLGGK